jgi:hypothetical protein
MTTPLAADLDAAGNPGWSVNFLCNKRLYIRSAGRWRTLRTRTGIHAPVKIC